MSSYLIKAASELPAKPTAIRKIDELSDKHSIALEWDAVPDNDLQTTGYQLFMAPLGSRDFKLIYDG